MILNMYTPNEITTTKTNEEKFLMQQDYQTLLKTTVMMLEEIKNRAADVPSAVDDLDIPQEGTIQEIIEFENSPAFEEALRIDAMNDVLHVELDNIIATLEDEVND